MKRIDIDGSVYLVDDNGEYRYKTITTPEGWKVLLRDNGYRIQSLFIGELPKNPPIGERDWELVWEYKEVNVDSIAHMLVDQIMGGSNVS